MRKHDERHARPARKARAFFLRGLITILPVIFTILILVTVYRFVSQYVTGPVNRTLYWSLERTAPGWQVLRLLQIDPYDPAYLDIEALPLDLQVRIREAGYTAPFSEELASLRDRRERFLRNFNRLAIHGDRLRRDVAGRVPPVIGLGLSLLLVLWLGSLAGGYMGRRLGQRAERTMLAIPVVRSIYPYTKQLVDFFLAERTMAFDTVVAVPYPSAGLWSIGFVTSSALRTLRAHTGENMVSVFVPSSPMPMTGYTIFLAAERLVPLPFTVDEALRVVVSGGVLIPPAERVDIDSASAMALAHPKEEPS